MWNIQTFLFICLYLFFFFTLQNCAPGYKRVLEGPLAGICSSIDEQVGTPPDTICEEGYTGPDCGQCEEGYSPYEGGCTRYPETYCEVAGSIGVGVNKKCLCKVLIFSSWFCERLKISPTVLFNYFLNLNQLFQKILIEVVI